MTKTEVSREFKKVIEFLRYGYHLQAAKLLFKKAETQNPEDIIKEINLKVKKVYDEKYKAKELNI